MYSATGVATVHIKEKYKNRYVDTVKQKGSSDCDVIFIATATALCQGERPEQMSWDQAMLRDHLVSCFDKKDMAGFPLTTMDKRTVKTFIVQFVPVYCNCWQPSVHKVFMAQYDKCKEWYHENCEKLPPKVTLKIFLCVIIVFYKIKRLHGNLLTLLNYMNVII